MILQITQTPFSWPILTMWTFGFFYSQKHKKHFEQHSQHFQKETWVSHGRSSEYKKNPKYSYPKYNIINTIIIVTVFAICIKGDRLNQLSYQYDLFLSRIYPDCVYHIEHDNVMLTVVSYYTIIWKQMGRTSNIICLFIKMPKPF